MRGQYEYRVSWQRERQGKKRALYQTLQGAVLCSKRQRTAAEEMDWLDPPLAPLVFGPEIERREIGEWKALPK